MKVPPWALDVAVLLLAGLGTAWALVEIGQGKSAEMTARLEAGRADAALATAKDAAETVSGLAAAQAATDTLTMENRDAILSAPGATVPVDPALHDVSLQRLCLRAAYRGREQCLRFTPAR